MKFIDPSLKFFRRRLLGLPIYSPLSLSLETELTRKTSVNVAWRFCIIALKEDAECPLANAAVRTIELYKQMKNRAEHDYLILTIVDRTTVKSFAGPPFGLIKIDRTYNLEDGNPLFAAAFSSSLSSHSSLSETPASIPANDAVLLIPPTSTTHKRVISVTFTLESAPSWLDVVVAPTAVSKHSPDYILLSRQCYWYAAMVMRVLIGEQDPRVLPSAQSTKFEVAFKPTLTSECTPQTVVPGRDGTFKSIFRLVTERDIDELYNKEIKDVYLALHQDTHKKLQQAVAARQAVKQRVEMAEQSAEMAKQARKMAEAELALLREQCRPSHTAAHAN
ncbi:hypothetical protein C2E23DRAFT_845946 [Lenzites betulinus]|nr:hypothetical protein C2E23DRAFT_845946 [Lenzites betulinus]